MPGYPESPIGPLGPHWTAVTQALRALQQQVQALTAGAQQTNIVDQYGNTIIVVGQLNQTITIGATSALTGVEVNTGLTGAGLCSQQGLATGTITVTKGSTAATLVSTISGTFTNGDLIGAADVNDPSSGTPTPAIVPGTTFTIAGSAVTLSQAAAESGTALYCAACTFQTIQTSAGGPPSGAAGGVLTGAYPNPGMAAGAAATNVGTLGGALTGTLPNPGLAAGAGVAAVIAAGSLGSSYTLALAGVATTQVTGTLTANCAITVTGLSAGCAAVLLLQQNSTGNWTLTIDGSLVTIPTAGNAAVSVLLYSPNGTDLWIIPGPQVGPQGGPGAVGPPGPQGNPGPSGQKWNVVAATTSSHNIGNNELTEANYTSGTQTLNSPASAASGNQFYVVNTSGHPVTLSAAAGSFYGPGFSGGAGSIQLNTAGAFVEFVADGTNWVLVAGAQDTGWLTVANGSMSNSWVNGSPAFGYRLQGNTVRLRGVLASGGSGQTALTLPSGYRPTQIFVAAAEVVGFATGEVYVDTGGVLQPAYASAGSGVSCDSITFTVD